MTVYRLDISDDEFIEHVSPHKAWVAWLWFKDQGIHIDTPRKVVYI